jgi:hypothetical protein
MPLFWNQSSISGDQFHGPTGPTDEKLGAMAVDERVWTPILSLGPSRREHTPHAATWRNNRADLMPPATDLVTAGWRLHNQHPNHSRALNPIVRIGRSTSGPKGT